MAPLRARSIVDSSDKEVVGSANTKAQPMLVSYEVSKDVYTLTRLGAKNTDVTNV